MPNVEAEFYDNKKCDWGKKKKKLQSLIGFLSANEIDNSNRGEKKEKKNKIQNNLQNK